MSTLDFILNQEHMDFEHSPIHKVRWLLSWVSLGSQLSHWRFGSYISYIPLLNVFVLTFLSNPFKRLANDHSHKWLQPPASGQGTVVGAASSPELGAVIIVSSVLNHLIWEHGTALPLAGLDYSALNSCCFSSMSENNIFHFTMKVSSWK